MYPYKFEYYRFQLVPKKVVQLSIDNVAYTYDEIKAKKNEYFSDVLTKTTFKGKKGISHIGLFMRRIIFSFSS